MASKPSILFSLMLLLLGMSSCDLFGDACDDCQSAIDHMYEKIDDFGCNKSLMQEAQKRIRDNCNADAQNPEYIIDCIVENCYSLSPAPPLCPAPGVGIPLLVVLEYKTFGAGELNAIVECVLLSGGEAVKQRDVPISENQTVVFEDWIWDDGDQFQIQLFDTTATANALTPIKKLDLRVRHEPAGQLRQLFLRFDSSLNEYTVTPLYW